MASLAQRCRLGEDPGPGTVRDVVWSPEGSRPRDARPRSLVASWPPGRLSGKGKATGLAPGPGYSRLILRPARASSSAAAAGILPERILDTFAPRAAVDAVELAEIFEIAEVKSEGGE